MKRNNWLNTIKNLIWKWYQKVISPTLKKLIKSLKVTKKDYWDLNLNIWIRFVKHKSKSLKRKELKMTLKLLPDTKEDIKKPSLLCLKLSRNLEESNTDLKISLEVLLPINSSLTSTLNWEKISMEKMSNTNNFCCI